MSEIENVKPLSNRVLILPAPAEEKSEGGIIIPDTAKERPAKGTVVSVGPGKPNVPMTSKVGDNVLYSKYSGTEVELFGKSYLIMSEEEVLLTY